MRIIQPALLVFTLIIFFSCKKNYDEQVAPGDDRQITKNATPTFPLEWENVDFMPTPPGIPTVVVPWGSGASRQISKEMANDYHKSDGWTLVYNTFSTTSLPDNWYFMLYNVYRGILRLYYYVPPTANYVSSVNIVHALSTEGTYAVNSPILNFANRDVVRADTNYTTGTTVEQWQVARSTWYAFQYELAYDKNMSAQNYSTFSFVWPVRSSNIVDVNINGIASGSLTGSIAIPGNDLTLSPNFQIDGSKGNTTITINGSSDAEKMKPSLGQTIFNSIKAGITDGLKGVAKNLLSGLFKKTSNTLDENVHLKLQAKISLQGTLTNNSLISSPVHAIPGYNQTGTPGYVPAYAQPLGVFYITAKPIIRNTRTISIVTLPDGTRERRYRYVVALDNNSYQLYFNPAVTSIATIQADVVSLNPDQIAQDGGIKGKIETIAGYTAAYGHVTGGQSIDGPMGFGTLVVRITFEVVPNNGASPAVITKSFFANVININN
jgi:hypothetical protein